MREIQGKESICTKVAPFRVSCFPSIFYSKALYDLPVPLAILDQDAGVFVEINQSALDLLGVFASRIIGKKFDEVFVRDREQSNGGSDVPEVCALRGRYAAELGDGVVQRVVVSSGTVFGHKQRRFCILVFRSAEAQSELDDDSFSQVAGCVGAAAYEAFKAYCVSTSRHGGKAGSGLLVLGVEGFMQGLSGVPLSVRNKIVERLLSRVGEVFGGELFVNRRQPMEFWVRFDPKLVRGQDLHSAFCDFNAPLNVGGLMFEPDIRGGLSKYQISDDSDFRAAVAEARSALKDAVASSSWYSDKKSPDNGSGGAHLVSQGARGVQTRKELEIFYAPVASLEGGSVLGYRVMLGRAGYQEEAAGRSQRCGADFEESIFQGEAVRLKLLSVLDLINRRCMRGRVFWIDASIDHLLDTARFERLMRLLKRCDVHQAQCIGLNLLHSRVEVHVQKLRSRLSDLGALGIRLSQDEKALESRGMRPGGGFPVACCAAQASGGERV